MVVEGVEYSAEEFNHILALKALNETLQTDLEEKEEIEGKDMSEAKNGRHVEENGEIRWYKNDILHRTDGPAIEYPDESSLVQ